MIINLRLGIVLVVIVVMGILMFGGWAKAEEYVNLVGQVWMEHLLAREMYSNSDPSMWADQRMLESGSMGNEELIRNILGNGIGIEVNDDGLESVSKVGSYVFASLDDKRGVPYIDTYNNFFEMWQYIAQGREEVWCYQFAAAYTFWANKAGISTRMVSLRTRNEGTFQQHTLAESYIREFNSWVMVDLTHGVMYLMNKSGRLLSAYDVLKIGEGYNAGDDINLRGLCYVSSQEGAEGLNTVNEVECGDEQFLSLEQYFNKHTCLEYHQDSDDDARRYVLGSKLCAE